MDVYNKLSTKDLFDYVLEFKSDYLEFKKRIFALEDFKSDFLKKKDFEILKKKNFDLDPTELSNHFGKSYENFRQLKKKYQDTKDINSTWVVYCKAYHFDKINKK